MQRFTVFLFIVLIFSSVVSAYSFGDFSSDFQSYFRKAFIGGVDYSPPQEIGDSPGIVPGVDSITPSENQKGEQEKREFEDEIEEFEWEDGYEPECDNGLDDDGDGFVDEEDPDCGLYDTEFTPECADGEDNDGDQLTDSEDPGCQLGGNIFSLGESSATTECQDGDDNDLDLYEDLDDPNCESPTDDSESPFDSGLTVCSDGIDNDGDGVIDYPTDTGCFAVHASTEENTQCNDGIDNDGDGAVDWPDDFSCSSFTDDDEEFPKSQCQDGLDNECSFGECDLFIDLEDPNCFGEQDNSENFFSWGRTECSDGIDNDDDTFFYLNQDTGYNFTFVHIDCGDFSCITYMDDLGHSVCGPWKDDEGSPQAECQDGIDNDGDGYIDYGWYDYVNDPAPFTGGVDRSCSYPQDNSEGPVSECMDGIDNDGDGYIDFQDTSETVNDFGCLFWQDFTENNPVFDCQDGIDNDGDGYVDYGEDNNCFSAYWSESYPLTECQDGIDNDGDGAIDWPNDLSCQNDQDFTESGGPVQCNDGVDNDLDGFIDLADEGCSHANDISGELGECQDGIDNDGDGAIDFPADSACGSASQNSEGDGDYGEWNGWDDYWDFNLGGFEVSCSDLEDNDVFETAVLLPSDCTSFVGEIDSVDDVDVYFVPGLGYGDRLIAEVHGSEGLNTNLAVFDRGLDLIKQNNDVYYFQGQLDPFVAVIVRVEQPGAFLVVSLSTAATFSDDSEEHSGEYTIEIDVTQNYAENIGLNSQRLLLDFDGADEEVNIGNEDYEVPTFDAASINSQWGGEETEQMKEIIYQRMLEDFESFDVDIYTTDMDELPEEPYTTLYFGGLNQQFLGLAVRIDTYNQFVEEEAIIFTEDFSWYYPFPNPSLEQVALAISNVAGHEAGHLLGLEHANYHTDPDDLMVTAGSAEELWTNDDVFRRSRLQHSVSPIGHQDGVKSILAGVGAG